MGEESQRQTRCWSSSRVASETDETKNLQITRGKQFEGMREERVSLRVGIGGGCIVESLLLSGPVGMIRAESFVSMSVPWS